jgi:hypothetical protein
MTIDTSLTYKIIGRQSGKCIYSNFDGRFGISKCDLYDDQYFKFEKVGDYYKIKGVNSGKCIYAHDYFGHWDCINDEAQLFKLEKVGGDGREYKIYGKHSQKCVFHDPIMKGANPGVSNFHVATCADGDDQRFYFVPVEFNCCFANIERPGAATTIEYGLQCDSQHTDPGGTACTNIYANYCKVGDRVITDSKCNQALQKSNKTLFNELMGARCNLDQFYKTTECMDWCKENTACVKSNTETSCKEFEIPTSECSPQKILDVEIECRKYGIKSDVCSLVEIKALTDKCKEYKILDTCTPDALDHAIDNATLASGLAASLSLAEDRRKEFERTQQTIRDLLAATATLAPAKPTATLAPAKPTASNKLDTIKTWIENNFTTFMIIVSIVVLIICSSSSVLLLLKKRKSKN